MKAESILKSFRHRTVPYPSKPWLLRQSWRNVIFLHWQVQPEWILPHLPKGVQLDLLNGQAWVSLVAFRNVNTRLRLLPGTPGMNDFAELNLRTYVVRNGISGVHFLSIYADNSMAVAAHKLAGLPYQKAGLHIDATSCQLHHDTAVEKADIKIQWKSTDLLVAKKPADSWLTERYFTFQKYIGRTWRYPIHHTEWVLTKVDLTGVLEYRWQDLKLTMDSISIAHYANGVDTLFWAMER